MKLKLKTFSMTFDGSVLNRGFWIYIWDIHSTDRFLYVGRTGDSSSPNASSPFSRISQHLNFRASAKGNSIAKRLLERNIFPNACSYEMIAIGPIFPEQDNFEAHIPYRDKMATLEKFVADLLCSKGYSVLGKHFNGSEVEPSLIEAVRSIVDEKFPCLRSTS
jgi:hypothetical protein